MKSMRFLAAAGLLAAVGAAPAFGWTGELVQCTATAGTPIDVTFKKGLSCKDTLNKIGIKIDATVAPGQPNGAVDGCVANPAAPWDAWVAGKLGKTSAADAANIGRASVSIKGQTFGSCNFGGSPTSGGASGAGAVTFFDAAGVNKIKGAKLKFFGTVSGDVATFSAQAVGLVTKGLGVGGDISIGIGLDLAAPENGLVLACNTGGVCADPNDPLDPANATPVTLLKTITAGAPFPPSQLIIKYGDADPNDPNDPFSDIP